MNDQRRDGRLIVYDILFGVGGFGFVLCGVLARMGVLRPPASWVLIVTCAVLFLISLVLGRQLSRVRRRFRRA